MKCQYCDSTLKTKSIFCPNCGHKVDGEKKKKEKVEETTTTEEKKEDVKQEQVVNQTVTSNPASNDQGAVGWGVLGFFVPIAGFVLFFVWLHERPKSSKASLIGALIRLASIILLIGFLVIYSIAGTYKTANNLYNDYRNNDYDYYDYFDDYDYDYNYNYDYDYDYDYDNDL